MSNPINALCDEFNLFVGRLSQIIIAKRYDTCQNETCGKDSDNFFNRIGEGLKKMVNVKTFDIDYQADKAFLAYNIKAVLYNVSTVVAIVGLAGTIFGGPLGLMALAAGIGGRMFIDRAMQRTFWGAIGNNHQKTDDTIYSLLFKSLLPSAREATN